MSRSLETPTLVVVEPDSDASHKERTIMDLIDVVLPQHMLRHLSIHARKQLRAVCKRFCYEVDRCVETLTITRFNIDALTMIQLPTRFPAVSSVVFQSCEPDSVTSFLTAHLRSMQGLGLVDFCKYHASIKPDLWEQLVLHLPPKAVLRLNINDSFMRRFSLEEALASLRQLHAAKPNVTLDFNTGHHYFGFRDTSPEVLSFFAAADYIKGLSFSLGLHGRATQNEGFFSAFQGNTRLTSVALTTHEVFAGAAHSAPLLQRVSSLCGLTRISLDDELTLGQLMPLQACPGLRELCVDLLHDGELPEAAGEQLAVALRQAAVPASTWHRDAQRQQQQQQQEVEHPPASTAASTSQQYAVESLVSALGLPFLPQLCVLTLGSDSHVSVPFAALFPGLTLYACEPATREGPQLNCVDLAPLEGLAKLRRLELSRIRPAEVLRPQRLSALQALTELVFVHDDTLQTHALLHAAAKLPCLQHLRIMGHEYSYAPLTFDGLVRYGDTAASSNPHAGEASVETVAAHPDFTLTEGEGGHSSRDTLGNRGGGGGGDAFVETSRSRSADALLRVHVGDSGGTTATIPMLTEANWPQPQPLVLQSVRHLELRMTDPVTLTTLSEVLGCKWLRFPNLESYRLEVDMDSAEFEWAHAFTVLHHLATDSMLQRVVVGGWGVSKPAAEAQVFELRKAVQRGAAQRSLHPMQLQMQMQASSRAREQAGTTQLPAEAGSCSTHLQSIHRAGAEDTVDDGAMPEIPVSAAVGVAEIIVEYEFCSV